MSTSRRIWRWIKALSLPALQELLFCGFYLVLFFVPPILINEVYPKAPLIVYLIGAFICGGQMFRIIRPKQDLLIEYVRQELNVRWRWVNSARGQDAEMRSRGAHMMGQLLTGAIICFAIISDRSLTDFFNQIGLPLWAAGLMTFGVLVLLWIETMRYFLARVKAVTLLCFVDNELLWISRWMSGWERERMIEQIRREDEV